MLLIADCAGFHDFSTQRLEEDEYQPRIDTASLLVVWLVQIRLSRNSSCREFALLRKEGNQVADFGTSLSITSQVWSGLVLVYGWIEPTGMKTKGMIFEYYGIATARGSVLFAGFW